MTREKELDWLCRLRSEIYGKYYTAYVLDVERKGYTISKEVLDEIIKAESEE